MARSTYFHAQSRTQRVRYFHVSLKLRGGAQLGKAVKGRSKDASRNGNAISEDERRLQESIRRMEMNDLMKKLTLSNKTTLLEFMAREEAITRMNRLKIQNHWRKIMRLVKVEALRKEVEIRSQNHERDVDRKDAIIQMLDRDLDEAEEQYQLSLRGHLLNVDKLIDLQDERLLVLEKEFEQDLRSLETEFSIEKEKITARHLMDKNALLNIMSSVEQHEKEKESEARQEYEQLREEIRNKNLEDINVLRITLDSNIEELEQHFETAHLNYLQNTDQRTQDFKYLTAKDQDLSRDIELKIRKIERLQSSIVNWRAKIAQNVKECTERNRALEAEKLIVSKHFQKLKRRMNKSRDNEKKRLTELSNSARKAKATLGEHIQLAERIINLGELVSKLETEREHILPFYPSTIADEKEANDLTESVRLAVRSEQSRIEDDQKLIEYQSCGINNSHVVSEWEYLDLFYKRYNKVVLDDLAIQREKLRYEKENQELQTILQQYLDGISVNNNVMNKANPLLVVNGRLKVHQSSKNKMDMKTIIDANHMVQTNRISK